MINGYMLCMLHQGEEGYLKIKFYMKIPLVQHMMETLMSMQLKMKMKMKIKMEMKMKMMLFTMVKTYLKRMQIKMYSNMM